MPSTTDNMLRLLRCSLNGLTADGVDWDDKEWERLFWLARRHGLVTMVNDAIELLPDAQKPQGDIALSWTLSADRTRYHYAHQKEVLESIDRKAREQGLCYVLLKGMSLSRFYPTPDSRPCGDIDIMFPGNFERGNALLGHPEAKAVGKHSEMEIDGVTVENHRQMLDLNYESQWEAEDYILQSLHPVPDNHFLPPMANMVYLLMHTVSHLTARNKLPLRNVIDWGMFLRANRAELDPDECRRIVKKLGMAQSFALFTQIASDITGSDLSAFIKEPVRQKDRARMLDLILNQTFVESVPKDLPFAARTLARLRRYRKRRWLYRYLPYSPRERFRATVGLKRKKRQLPL